MDEKTGVPQDLAAYLRAMKIKPSVIRMKVLEYLVMKRNHPTADMIFKDLAADMHTLSKTSVYNTLKSFACAGVVQEIRIEPTQVRYDAFTHVHGHFKCNACGSVEDLALEAYHISSAGLEGKKILEQHVYVLGLCGKCNTNKNGKKHN